VREPKPSEIKRVREELEMSQSAFAKAFHLNLRTLQKWEIGEARPDGPARVLLWLIINAPQVILKLLKGSG
jgi:putative transcriptional regulator